ncbi:MAG TPA: hypothetical protein PLO55_13235 [Thermotogota bacterium]|nr:hypothetical protein [Thermotogota bacterium]
MIDATCIAYETRIQRLMRDSRRLMRQISKTSPRDPKMKELWLKHRIIWNNIERIQEHYKTYRTAAW